MHPLKEKSIARLIILTATRLEQFANAHVLNPIGLNMTTAKIMGFLYIHEKITPSDILKFTGGTKSNITQRLNNLEKKGFIRRLIPESGAIDKRKILVSLTKKGRNKFDEAHKLINKDSLDLEKEFSQKENNLHYEFLKKINILLNQHEYEHPKKINNHKKYFRGFASACCPTDNERLR
ncbi:MAG: MarR family transcriptional regulator [Patescibacteria group bacterium]|jgi:DNA-binding MarR family transcriptional regulator